jgi:hypothetical protein
LVVSGSVEVEREVEVCGLTRELPTLPPDVVAGLGEGICAKLFSAHRRMARHSPEMFFIKQKSRIVAYCVIGQNQIFDI